jgi:hypothetical protein
MLRKKTPSQTDKGKRATPLMVIPAMLQSQWPMHRQSIAAHGSQSRMTVINGGQSLHCRHFAHAASDRRRLRPDNFVEAPTKNAEEP